MNDVVIAALCRILAINRLLRKFDFQFQIRCRFILESAIERMSNFSNILVFVPRFRYRSERSQLTLRHDRELPATRACLVISKQRISGFRVRNLMGTTRNNSIYYDAIFIG